MTTEASNLIIRRAQDGDFKGIFALQSSNYSGNIGSEERQDGFLSIVFSEDKLREMAADGITVVARDGDEIAGFLSTQTCRYNLDIPLPRTMIESLENSASSDADFDRGSTLVCGPVCIGKQYRGQGILERMYQELAVQAQGKFTTGITFVALENPRSLIAHEKKLGMRPVVRFDFNGKPFQILCVELARYLPQQNHTGRGCR